MKAMQPTAIMGITLSTINSHSPTPVPMQNHVITSAAGRAHQGTFFTSAVSGATQLSNSAACAIIIPHSQAAPPVTMRQT